MSKIDAIASTNSGPVTTKTALRTLVKDEAHTVRITPANPSPALAHTVGLHHLPSGRPVTVHTGKSTAVVERKFNGQIVVR